MIETADFVGNLPKKKSMGRSESAIGLCGRERQTLTKKGGIAAALSVSES
ncbi:hypothetical protein [Mesorhizobium sp. dw_380]|nr:hypothetical protein [Mesorhizobium sp. dw_380]